MMAGLNGNEDEWSSYQQVGKRLWPRKGCINWRKCIELTEMYHSFSKNFLWGRKEISRKGYFIFSSLLCMCVPLKRESFVLKTHSEKNCSQLSSHKSLKEEGLTDARCTCHATRAGEMGMSGQWSISDFIFWESGPVTEYMEERWKQSKGKISQRQ